MTKSEIIQELDFIQNYRTPIIPVFDADNHLYIKKEDCIPFSFGGNKCRIAASYFKQLVSDGCDTVVTYGASSSNLCRVLANMACRYGIKCVIVTPDEQASSTCNSEMVELCGAEKVLCPLDNVSSTIDQVMRELRETGKPYFIYGGGHGVPGTDSYRNVLRQIVDYENEHCISFDYIFITLATGTSISGLIAENELSGFGKHIVGVTIAREHNRVCQIMREALTDYDKSLASVLDNGHYEILGDYTMGGYGKYTDELESFVKNEFKINGMNLDTTYTGKAFFAMRDFILKNNIKNKNILFIHTGGTPLFFKDGCRYLNEKKQ